MYQYEPSTQMVIVVKPEKPLSKKDFLKCILVESNETLDLPVASILFDDKSILFNDDEELG